MKKLDDLGELTRKPGALFRLLTLRPANLGLPPGSIGDTEAVPERQAVVTRFHYDEHVCEEMPIVDYGGLKPAADVPGVTWINVDGVGDLRCVSRIAEDFGLHPLVTENIANTGQRPKIEVWDDYVYLVALMVQVDAAGELQAEQVSIVLGPNWVVSFQERPGDVFDPLRERLRRAAGRVRRMGADYLFYSLIDAMVDNLFAILEHLGERVESVQDRVLGDPDPHILDLVHRLKTELIFIRKSIWPLREAIANLERNDTTLITRETGRFMRDAYDHVIQVMDAIETYRDVASGLFDLYLSSVSNRMNEVMKVLTIIATIFIPITFIAGVYGMNFEHDAGAWNMPELTLPYGYPLALLSMALVAVGMLIYFRHRRWL